MALGTLTVTPRGTVNEVAGDRQMRRFTVACTSGANYTTGGEPITAALLGLNVLESVYVNQPPAGTRLVAWDHVNGKLKVFTAIGTEAGAASDQSAFVVTGIAFGY